MAATLLAWTAGLAAAENPPANLFANPSFEQGREGWRMDKAGKTDARFAVDAADAKDGQSSALVTIAAVDDWGTQFGQSFDGGAKGKTYTFAALAKATKAPVKLSLQIERSGEPYDRAARTDEVALKPGEWTELHVTFKVEKDFKQGWFAYASCTQPNCEYRLDMVRLYEGEFRGRESFRHGRGISRAACGRDNRQGGGLGAGARGQSRPRLQGRRGAPQRPAGGGASPLWAEGGGGV
jgi:hypothetical protein